MINSKCDLDFHFCSNVYLQSVPSVRGSPPTIQNTTYIMENQTTAVYTCLSGYIANESNSTSYCVDNVWSRITLTCVGKMARSFNYIVYNVALLLFACTKKYKQESFV